MGEQLPSPEQRKDELYGRTPFEWMSYAVNASTWEVTEGNWYGSDKRTCGWWAVAELYAMARMGPIDKPEEAVSIAMDLVLNDEPVIRVDVIEHFDYLPNAVTYALIGMDE